MAYVGGDALVNDISVLIVIGNSCNNSVDRDAEIMRGSVYLAMNCGEVSDYRPYRNTVVDDPDIVRI
ncbi:MAG: hypothetical protein WBW04_21245 [Nitrolancea sp.]